MNVTAATGVGVLGASQTLIPQAIGDKNYRMVCAACTTPLPFAHICKAHALQVGATLQRSLLVSMLLSLAIALSWLPFSPILVAMGQHPDVTNDVSTFLGYSVTSLPAWLAYFSVQSYLNGMGVWWPAVIAIVVSNVAQLGITALLMNGAGEVIVSVASQYTKTTVFTLESCPVCVIAAVYLDVSLIFLFVQWSGLGYIGAPLGLSRWAHILFIG